MAATAVPEWSVTLFHRGDSPLTGVTRTYEVEGRTLADAEAAARREWERSFGAGSARPDLVGSLRAHRILPQRTASELGFCVRCIRVRWLERVTHRDSAGNPNGVCRSCARDEEGNDG